ncbi:transposase domain-containing protein [Sphingomonas carotinifaciens]|uniref:transposase domain-containing protein n=1 Tax=Sphingomonas carotinifaciens TaxID=1166323 RepID=UPI0039A15D16
MPETAKWNRVNPQNRLVDVLDLIERGHLIERLDELPIGPERFQRRWPIAALICLLAPGVGRIIFTQRKGTECATFAPCAGSTRCRSFSPFRPAPILASPALC